VPELPNLTPFNSTPGLYMMALGYVLLLGVVTFLVHQKTDYAENDRKELTRLLTSCMERSR